MSFRGSGSDLCRGSCQRTICACWPAFHSLSCGRLLVQILTPIRILQARTRACPWGKGAGSHPAVCPCLLESGGKLGPFSAGVSMKFWVSSRCSRWDLSPRCPPSKDFPSEAHHHHHSSSLLCCVWTSALSFWNVVQLCGRCRLDMDSWLGPWLEWPQAAGAW